jgi:hypothetical protein
MNALAGPTVDQYASGGRAGPVPSCAQRMAAFDVSATKDGDKLVCFPGS